MDKKFGPPWHIVAGKYFSYDVTYEVRPCFLAGQTRWPQDTIGHASTCPLSMADTGMLCSASTSSTCSWAVQQGFFYGRQGSDQTSAGLGLWASPERTL